MNDNDKTKIKELKKEAKRKNGKWYFRGYEIIKESRIISRSGNWDGYKTKFFWRIYKECNGIRETFGTENTLGEALLRIDNQGKIRCLYESHLKIKRKLSGI